MENTEVIKQQMAETRTALSEKLEALEHQFVDTVKNTTEAITGTVDAVKETVADTVGTVKETVTGTVDAVKNSVTDSVEAVKGAFDIRTHVENHPWAAFGTAVAVGFLVGKLVPSRLPSLPYFSTGASHTPSAYTPAPSSYASSSRETKVEDEKPGWFSSLAQSFAPAIDKLKSMAIGASAGVVGELVLDAIPDNMKQEANKVLADVTESLGGTNLRNG